MAGVDTDQNEMNSAPLTCLVFELGDAMYALDAMVVKETFWMPLLSVTEELPKIVAGVFEMNDMVVPVIDLQRRLGHEQRDIHVNDCVILIEVDSCLAGILANRVVDVSENHLASMSCHGLDESQGSKLRIGEIHVEDGIATLLNPAQLLALSQGEQEETRTPLHYDITGDDREVMSKRAESLRSRESGKESYDNAAVAVVTIDGEKYGLELTSVREFAVIDGATPIPCCPDYILGNSSLRGDIVTVIDIRAALHIPVRAIEKATNIVVMQQEGMLAGLPVDDVIDVIEVDLGSAYAYMSTPGVSGDKYLKGELPYDERVVSILDLEKIFSEAGLAVDEAV